MGNNHRDIKALKYLREIEFEYFILRDKVAALEEKINIDFKTDLLRYNPDYLQKIVKTATRFQDASKVSDVFCISYRRLDLDDFSEINNRCGHDMGDTVLIEVAKTIKQTIRTTDYAIRCGGEEFDIILPYTDTKGACKVAENHINNIKTL
jgi:diguanylate cyclase (GGDEF)-like protein